MNDKLIYAQDYYNSCSIGVASGFNLMVLGGDIGDVSGYSPREGMYTGFHDAEQAFKEGKIFVTHPFIGTCGHRRYRYGGKWACDNCFNAIETPKDWIIKVMKDGNAFVCIGIGFTNLQESDNYTFGNSFKAAIDNYGKQVILHETL